MLLLDCTLRDGGYVNDWEFGYDNIVNIYERLVSAKVDIIEVGFIDERRLYDVNRSIFPDTESMGRTFEKRKRQTMRLTLKYTPLVYERRGFLHSSGRLSDHGIR